MSDSDFSDDSDGGRVGNQSNPFSNRNIHFGGTLEKSKLLSQKENKAKQSRLLEVRKQEAELAKQKREQFKNAKHLEETEEEKQKKFEVYLEKKRLLEQLMEMKQQAAQEIGMAHRNAEDVEKLKNSRLHLKMEEKMRIEQLAEERSKQALEKQKKIDEDRYQAVHQHLERKKQLISRAHKNAEAYRETHKSKTQENDDPQISYDQFDKNLPRKTFSSKGSIDFSKSHLHNPIVVNHKHEIEVESAIDKANKEAERTVKRQEETLNSKEEIQKKAAERAQKIMQQEKSKKILEDFDNEMYQIEKLEKITKIKAGKSDPRTEVKPGAIKQTQKRVQQEASKEFEEKILTIKPEVSKPNPIKSESTKYQDDLVVVVDGDIKTSLPKKAVRSSSSQENLIKKPNLQKKTDSEPTITESKRETKSLIKKDKLRDIDEMSENSRSDQNHENDSNFKINKFPKNYIEESQEDEEPRSFQEKPVLLNQQSSDQESNKQLNYQIPPQFINPNGYQQFYPPHPQFMPPQFNNFMMPTNGIFYPPQFFNPIPQTMESVTSNTKNSHQKDLYEKEIQNSKNSQETQISNEHESGIKDYIREQEEFLQKLERDRKKLRDKLEHENRVGKLKEDQNQDKNTFPKIRDNNLLISNEDTFSAKKKDHEDKLINVNRGRSENDELAELQRKTDELLEKFMNPSEKKNSKSPEMRNNIQFRYEHNYNQESYDENEDELEHSQSTPQKSDKKKYKSYVSSPISELNYSISEKDKSAMKSQNLSQTFERSKLMETDKFSNGYQTFGNRENQENHKPNLRSWKLGLDTNDHDGEDIENNEEENNGLSLADMFKKNKKKILERYEQQKERQKSEERETKGKRTKEEILKQRKEMMKPNLIKKNLTNEDDAVDSQREVNQNNNYAFSKGDKKGKKEPNPELLSRLARGEKTKVDKKEMKALTNKNYELLPEVKKRREEERKKEELKQRLEKSRKLGNKIRDDLMIKP